MTNDFWFVISWWFLLFIIGFSFFPLTLSLFQKFFDQGYAFSKIMGILIISYLVWLLGSLRIFPFLAETVWLMVIVAALGNLLLLQKNRRLIKKIIKDKAKIFFWEEFLFLAALAFWASIRGFQPNIQGLEKFMDFGFVNSLLRTRFFPPADMWLAGETINYYYFGHLVSAVLTKLSGLNSAITYNLMIATIFALALTAAFSLGTTLAHQLKLKIRAVLAAGLLSAALLTLGGNLHPLYYWLINHRFTDYWYPDATRFIVEKFGAADNTIHEFPLYSFVVADLHGHLINLPNVLLMLALIFVISQEIGAKKKLTKLGPPLFLLSLCLAIAFMTNAWDYPIYLAVAGGAIFLFNKLKWSWGKTFIQTAIIGASLMAGSLLLSLPFHLHFKSIAQGVALTDFHSPPWMLLVLWGFPLITTISFLLYLRFKKTINNQQLTINYFIFILLGISWLLIVIPEIVYLKDIYIHSHQRANTMFKLTYQAFVMFSLADGYLIVRLLTSLKAKVLKIAFFLLNFTFLIFIFIYPYFAIRSYYGITTSASSGLKNYRGLYGLAYLNQSSPDDYQAILWLNQKVAGQPVIVEAVGESYTDFARVSANTGLPTVLGWRVHEWLWRGSFDEPGRRTEEVRRIYESEDLEETKRLLKKYQVKYLFLGSLERKQYPHLKEEKLGELGEVVFSSGATKIYQLEIKAEEKEAL
jgi:uncharacterized membrane protein